MRGFIKSRFPSPIGSHVYRVIWLRSDAKLSGCMRRDRRREARPSHESSSARTASISLFPQRIKARVDFSLFRTVRARSPLNSFRATDIMLFNEFA